MLIPQTSVLGAILLTGYLGGATLAHLRVGDPFFAPIILGVLVWEGFSCAIHGCARSFPCGVCLRVRGFMWQRKSNE